MSSKNRILNNLRRAQEPFTDVQPVETRRKVVNLQDTSEEALKIRFIEEAEKLACYVHPAEGSDDALKKLLDLLEGEDKVLAWDDARLPFPVASALSEKNIDIAPHHDSQTLTGITGVSGALAATGSLIMSSGEGQYRTASLLPDKHIALMRVSQILPDFESWVQSQKESGASAFKESSNTVIISGPSKTADIGQELIKGAHGPRQVHIVLIE